MQNTIDSKYLLPEEEENPPVRVYTEPRFGGQKSQMFRGNYFGKLLSQRLFPSEIFSLQIPPNTAVRLYGGPMYNYGEVGSIEITNISDMYMDIKELPEQLAGNVRSISINSVPKISYDVHFSPGATRLYQTEYFVCDNFVDNIDDIDNVDNIIFYLCFMLLIVMFIFLVLVRHQSHTTKK